MFATIIGGVILHPGNWHDKFKIGLGLDLHGGTQVTLKAVAAHGGVPSKSDMAQAISILENRVNGLGINNTSVVQQGDQLINISIPGASVTQVRPLLKAAQLRFRQVLLCTASPLQPTACSGAKAGAGLPASAPTPVPSPIPSPLPTGTPTPTPTGRHRRSSAPAGIATPKSAPSPKASASKSGGNGQAAGAKPLAKASSSPSPSASSSPKATRRPRLPARPRRRPPARPRRSVRTPTPSNNSLKPVVAGDESQVSKPALALFKKLDCTNRKWQQKVYNGKVLQVRRRQPDRVLRRVRR